MSNVLVLCFFCVCVFSAQIPDHVSALVGVWKSSLPCETFCVISLPSHDSGVTNDVATLLAFDSLFETFIIKLVGDSPVVNVGAFGVEQRSWVLEYKQSIKDQFGNLQHEEVGTFVFEDNSTTCYRNGLIPHGVTMQGKGIHFPFPGKPLIGQLDTTPKNVNATTEYMQPFLANFSLCPSISLKDPNFALIQNNNAKNITKTFVYDFPTSQHLSLPFLDQEFGSTTIKATFWVNTISKADGSTSFELQYTESLAFLFGRLTQPVEQPEGLITWVHAITSTLSKVESPAVCDTLSEPITMNFAPIVATPTNAPTSRPTGVPTRAPTRAPTLPVTASPTTPPSNLPTSSPTGAPTTPPLQFCTYTHNDWAGSCISPDCSNTIFGRTTTQASCLSTCFFKNIFGTFTDPSALGLILGVVVDTPHKWVSFSSHQVASNFLNTQNGNPDAFNETFIDPFFSNTLSAGMLGSSLASAKMNIAFSLSNGINFTNCAAVDPLFAGQLVKDVVGWANMAITSQLDGVSPLLLTPTTLNNRFSLLHTALLTFNQAFRGCQNTPLSICFQ